MRCCPQLCLTTRKDGKDSCLIVWYLDDAELMVSAAMHDAPAGVHHEELLQAITRRHFSL